MTVSTSKIHAGGKKPRHCVQLTSRENPHPQQGGLSIGNNRG